MMNLLLLTTLLALAETRAPASQVAAIPVAAVWQEFSPHPNQKEPRQLEVGVWSDGTLVWRENDKHLTAKIDQSEVDKLLKDLDEMKFFDDPQISRQPNQYPPDASHFVVAADFGDKHQRLASWRDPPESGGERFKEIFMASRKRIRAIVPAKGNPTEKFDQTVYRVGRVNSR